MYILPQLGKITGVLHAFSTVEEGNQGFGFDNPDQCIIENRKLLFQRAGSYWGAPMPFERAASLVAMRPGYEETIVFADESHAGRGITTTGGEVFGEAIITDSELPLYLAIGDCYPIIMVDTGGPRRRLALVHAGRESTVRRIAEKVISAMKGVYGTDPADLLVGFGPGIRQDSYKLAHFNHAADDERWVTRSFVRETEGGVLVDLLGYNIMLLTEDCKVPRENIFVAPYDTYHATALGGATMFSSHRRAKDTGEPESRFGVVVRIVQ